MKICSISLNTIFFEGKCQLSLTTEQKTVDCLILILDKVCEKGYNRKSNVFRKEYKAYGEN